MAKHSANEPSLPSPSQAPPVTSAALSTHQPSSTTPLPPIPSELRERLEWVQRIFSFVLEAATAAEQTPALYIDSGSSPFGIHAQSAHVSILAPYAREFCQWLEPYCELHGDLRVHIRPFSLYYEHLRVIKDERDEGFLHRLFQDGVVSMTFSSGFSVSAAEQLFALLLMPSSAAADLTVGLWQLELPHLRFTQIDQLAPPPEEVLWEREQIVASLHQQMKQHPGYQMNFTGLPAEAEAPEPLDERWVLPSMTDQEALQRRLSGEAALLALRAKDLFLLMLTQLEDERDVEQFETWLLPVADSLLNAGEFYTLSFLVGDLLSLGKELQPSLLSVIEEAQAQLLAHLSSPERLRLLVGATAKGHPKGGVSAYAQTLFGGLGDSFWSYLEQAGPQAHLQVKELLEGEA